MGKRKYDKEFKLNALKLYEESDLKQRDFEREMGIGEGCISHWKREFREHRDEAFPGHGTPRDEQVAALKREIVRLRQERDILKKAVGIFSKPRETDLNS